MYHLKNTTQQDYKLLSTLEAIVFTLLRLLIKILCRDEIFEKLCDKKQFKKCKVQKITNRL